ncbi:hypothetical protein DRH29_00010 [candidate division Kazan bacterium]|uniref:Uncharacterized protein n=1 Tax=candidate division Kazan bacterium TaxID=2202143 RepID=A0A420ZDE7_UNCK3|nr:MAG: hypothetical protein DRH29_00010 [candidate division Kazan bacterium]
MTITVTDWQWLPTLLIRALGKVFGMETLTSIYTRPAGREFNAPTPTIWQRFWESTDRSLENYPEPENVESIRNILPPREMPKDLDAVSFAEMMADFVWQFYRLQHSSESDENIREHVGHCAFCQQQLVGLADRLMQAFTGEKEPFFTQAIERLKREIMEGMRDRLIKEVLENADTRKLLKDEGIDLQDQAACRARVEQVVNAFLTDMVDLRHNLLAASLFGLLNDLMEDLHQQMPKWEEPESVQPETTSANNGEEAMA